MMMAETTHRHDPGEGVLSYEEDVPAISISLT